MGGAGGRPPGRVPTEFEANTIRLLIEMRAGAFRFRRLQQSRLEDAVLALQEDGCSPQTIADVIGMSPSTVKDWTKQAKERRNTK